MNTKYPLFYDKMRGLKWISRVSDEEGNFLYKLAKGVPRYGVIVEIGSCTGYSTCWMAGALREVVGNGIIYAVDPWILSGEEDAPPKHRTPKTKKMFHQNIRELGLQYWIRPIMGFSRDVGEQWTQPIDLLYIDGSHKYEDVKTDFDTWHRFVKPDGRIAFHDYTNIEDVQRVVDGFVNKPGMFNADIRTCGRVWSAKKFADVVEG